MPQIELSDVNFAFNQECVVRDVNFRVADGEFVSLLGASGCGKSTLLRLMAGLIEPSSGVIKVGAETDVRSGQKSTEAKDVGFVFQTPTLCPWLNVLQNIELPIKLKGHRKPIRRNLCHEAIKLVGLSEGDACKLPHQLSGGMRMRVSLARAFVTKPKLMLMDEPFSALDEVLRQQLTETCLDLWRHEYWTTVFVTHNVAESVFLSQRIHILAGKPATIVDTIEVPFARRDRNLRTSSGYIQLVSEVSQRLRNSVEQAMHSSGSAN